jgi:hypothetical protein
MLVWHAAPPEMATLLQLAQIMAILIQADVKRTPL